MIAAAGDMLKKIYIEPTNRCNLNCSICVRQVWDEPMGDMPLASFKLIVKQLKT